MRRDHRPYYVKRAWLRLQKQYARHFIRPHLDHLGRGPVFMRPWHVAIFGPGIRLGNYVTVIAAPDGKVRLSVWAEPSEKAAICMGDYGLICPGVRISAAAQVRIGDNCMLASQVYITDSDWHDLYNRIAVGTPLPVDIGENVWIGDSAIICKGVTIGANTVVGAGSVVTKGLPANVVAAGNPARVIRSLDPQVQMTTRAQWFADPARLYRDFDILDRENLKQNSLGHWLRHLLFPRQGD